MCAAVLLPSTPARAESAAPPTEAIDPAVRMITSLVDGGDPALLPADFTTMLGYRPTITDGLLVKPSGSCSSPVALPREFDVACKAHDLGYDLLRYADRIGTATGGWARRALDDALDRRMHDACVPRSAVLARVRCQAMATVASAAVSVNSLRQRFGTP